MGEGRPLAVVSLLFILLFDLVFGDISPFDPQICLQGAAFFAGVFFALGGAVFTVLFYIEDRKDRL
ncbi:MAG: hypothetical protein IKS90_00040 [Clostridia bacterium]|nr:hypothetical protein [Clostridia bacterium]